MLGLGAGCDVVPASLPDLLGSLPRRTVAAGSLLFRVLSCHRSLYLAAFLSSCSRMAPLLLTSGDLVTFLRDAEAQTSYRQLQYGFIRQRVSASVSIYLSHTAGTKPVAFRYRGDLGFMAICVTAFVTAVTE